MKILSTFRPVFTPGNAGAGTLDFTAFPNFSINKLYAVIDTTQNTPIYVPGAPGLGATAITTPSGGTILTLAANTSSYSTTDVINVYYDASNVPTELNILQERNGNLDKLIEVQTNILIELRILNELMVNGFNLTDDLAQLRSDFSNISNDFSSQTP